MLDNTAKPAGAACLDCPARDAPCVRPEAARKGALRLAIVGEAPGHNEVRLERPFIGASGKMLERGLRSIGLARDNVHWTNAVLCDVKPAEQPAARKACEARLKAELEELRAPIVVPVGAWGLQSALGLKKKPQILKWRGTISELDGRHVMPTVHPAFVMRSPAWGGVLERDVARIGRVLDHGWKPPELAPGHRVVVAREWRQLEAGLAALGQLAAGDVETVGLGPVTTRMVCFALSDGRLTLVVPWSTDQTGTFGWWGERQREAASLVSRALSSRTIITHNGPAFDHIVFAQHGIKLGAWEDTLMWAHVTSSHLPKRLDFVASYWLDVGPWKQWESRSAGLEELWMYNARDTLYTYLVWQAAKEKQR